MSVRGTGAWPDAATLDAAHWHALHREGPLDRSQEKAFMDWLAASPEHLREYLAIALVAKELGEALHEMDIAVGEAPRPAPRPSGNVIPLPVRGPRPRADAVSARGSSKPRWRMGAAAAALACVALLSGVWPRTEVYAAGHGEQRMFVLHDRTRVRLDAESELQATIGPFQRRVRLLRGRAAFAVAEDHRPFEVLARGLRVEDIGTAFDVSLRRNDTLIGVSEGRVKVWTADASRAHEDDRPRLLAELSAGQAARVVPDERSASISAEDVDTMTAWMRGLLVFRDEPLEEVAAAFNRHNRARIVVEDSAAAAFRLTGRLRAHDVSTLRAFLERQPSLHVSAAGDEIRVRGRTQ